MPYARIALLGGKSADWLAAVSTSLQNALEQTFDVPAGDCFQVFQQCQPGELIYDREYGGGPRSGNFVLFHITGGRARSRVCKEAFYARLVELLEVSPGIPPADVMVVSVRSPLTAASATFALNAAECVRRVLFVISSVPLPALSLAQAPAKPLIRLSEFARPPLTT